MITRRDFHRIALLAAFPLLSARAHSSLPPLRSLQLVVPTPPGAQSDLIARWLIGPMAKSAGVPGLVLNRPGAAGAIAADTVLAAPPESGSLLLGGLDHVAYSHLGSNRRPLDPFVDFVPVAAVNRDTWLLVVGSDSPILSVRDLIEASRRSSLNFASNGEGSTAHLLTARFVAELGIDATHVPYKDSYLPDLVAQRIDFVIAPTPAMIPHVHAGRLRALSSLTDERLALARDVPSVRELGWPNQVFFGGLFLFAPAALAGRATEINQWLRGAIQVPEIRERYQQAGIEPVEQDLDQVRIAVIDRLRIVDSMRNAVFGRKR